MTSPEAKAYLRFEAELMAHLKTERRRRVDSLRSLGVPQQMIDLADRSYASVMDDMTVFGSLLLDREGAWDSVEEERLIATGIKVGPLAQIQGPTR